MHCGHRRHRHQHISLYLAGAISLASLSSPYSQLLTSYMGSWTLYFAVKAVSIISCRLAFHMGEWTLCSYIYAWLRPIYPFRSIVASCPLATSTTRAYACPCAAPFHGHVNQMRHQRWRRWSSRTGREIQKLRAKALAYARLVVEYICIHHRIYIILCCISIW